MARSCKLFARKAGILVLIYLFVSLVLLTNALAQPEAVFKVGVKFNGSYVKTFDWVLSGGWNNTASDTTNGVGRTNSASGSVSSSSVTFSSSVGLDGDPPSSDEAIARVEHVIEVWVRGGSTASVSASGEGEGTWNFPGAGNADLRYGTFLPWSIDDFTLENQTGSGSDSDSGSGNNAYAGTCSPTSTVSFTEWPGVVYRKIIGNPWVVTTYLNLNGYDQKSGGVSGTTTLSVTLGGSTPNAVAEGPYVSGVIKENPDIGDSVSIQNVSNDPDDGGGALTGICSAAWVVTYPDGTQTTPTGLGSTSFTASQPGPYSVQLTVTDNEGQTAQDTLGFTAGEERKPRPGDGPEDSSATSPECGGNSCCDNGAPGGGPSANDRSGGSDGGDDMVFVDVDRSSGNVHVVKDDPVATRGYPLTCRIHINSQTLLPNRTTAMGNAMFTYGIAVYEGNVTVGGNVELHRFVIDADGTELDYGDATTTPVAPAGVYPTLTVSGPGFELTGAGPPEDIYRAGNYDYAFDTGGKLVSITDPSGNTQELTYDTNDDLEQVEDLNSAKIITFEYDTPGTIARVVQNGGAAVTHLSYSSGRLTQALLKNSVGATIRRVDFTYNGAGLLETVKRDDDSNTTVTFSYVDSGFGVMLGNMTYTGGGSNLNYFAAPGSGAAFRTSQLNAKGGTIHYDWEADGDLLRITYPTLYGGTAAPVYNFGHDANHNRTSLSDGSTTLSMSYNSLGLLEEIDDNAGGVWTYTYSGVDLTGVSDSVSTVLDIEYNDTNNPHSPTDVTDGVGNTWTYSYNAYGQVTTITPPSGAPQAASSITYDENSLSAYYGYPLSLTNGAGDETEFDSYTALGDLSSMTTTPVTGVTNTYEFSYDAAQRYTAIEHPDSKTIEFDYTGRDLTSATDEAGTLYEFEYCAVCGKMTEFSAPLSKTLAWDLDGDFSITGFTDARSYDTTYGYGSAGELKQVTYPDSTYITFKYNNQGRFNKFTNGRGNTATLTYNTAGRVTEINYSPSGDTDFDYTYNDDGTLATATDEGGTITYTYYDNKLVESVSYNYSVRGLSAVQKLEYTYYPDDSLETLTWKNGTTTVASWEYAYDDAGRLETITNSFGETTTYTYDAEGKILTQTNDNGTITTYTWNHARGWPTDIEYSYSSTPFASYDLEYDDGANTVGNLTGVTELSTDTMAYEYDDLYRLISETRTGSNSYSNTYDYDLAGNLEEVNSSTFATYDNANKISTLSGGSVAYDDDGNITSTSGVLPNGASFQWSTINKLRRIQKTGGGSTTYYRWNIYGQRAHRSGVSPLEFYIYSGAKLIGMLKGSTASYAYTWGADGLVSQRVLSGTPASFWYHYGPQGETRQLTNSSGTVVDTYLYDAYGKVLATSGSDFNPFQYGGKFGYYNDGNVSGFLLAGQRWYSPHLRRWISRDPIEYGGGDNLFGYVMQNPVKFVDPTGLDQIVNQSGQPIIVSGNPGSGSGTGAQAFGVVPSDGQVHGGPQHPIPGYSAPYTPFLPVGPYLLPMSPEGGITDVDFYDCPKRGRQKIRGDEEGPITFLRRRRNNEVYPWLRKGEDRALIRYIEKLLGVR